MGGHLKNDDALLLAKALENNSALIELIFLGQIDENIETQLLKSLEQNRSIAKLRQYMLDHPIKRSDVLPLEVLDILVDKMIVSYLKSGHSYKDTVNAINEFLVTLIACLMIWRKFIKTLSREFSVGGNFLKI